MAESFLVTGEITFQGETSTFSGAVLRVRLENTGMMDAPAEIVSEQVTENVSSGDPLSFQLRGELPDERSQYNVRAHISMDGSADIQKGDYVSKQSYPVLTHGNPNHVQVQVSRV